MRKSLEKTITGPYRDIAREQIKQEEENITQKEQEELDGVLNWHLKNVAEERSQDKIGKKHLLKTENIQKRVFDIQKRKQEAVKWLEEERQRLNDPEYRPNKPAGSRGVLLEDGQYFVISDGKRNPITWGEIITDYELGIKYYLDPDSVPKALRKKYAFEEVKRELNDLLDEQIYLDEQSRGIAGISHPTHFKQLIIERGVKDKRVEEGFVAEIMVSNFLEKLLIDSGVDFELVRTDVYEDIVHKIDFAIRRKKHYRGIKIEDQQDEENSEKSKLGIQFTITSQSLNLAKKKKQIAQVKATMAEEIELDDIVLVNIKLKELGEIYNQWHNSGRSSGGPDKLWDMETKKEIAQGVFQGLMTQEEIEEIKSNIK
ncbi:MAG: hypothetical protein Q7K65_04570 [Candidatus Buchananbacteria bacterium]|nr:hypothetical protein [Candidatus Buchananbacteria bacterium]